MSAYSFVITTMTRTQYKGLEGVLEIGEIINIDKDNNSLMKAFNSFRLNLIATILCVPQTTFIK